MVVILKENPNEKQLSNLISWLKSLDALKAVGLPAVEVHLTGPQTREDFRHVSYAGLACLRTYKGLGFGGYRQAICFLREYLEKDGK